MLTDEGQIVSDIIPDSGPRFEAMMREIDAEFARDGLPIPHRPIHAIMVIGTRFKISMPLASLPSGAPPELQQFSQLSRNIHDWYTTIYGDRIKIDFSPGKTVIVIDGDLYRVSLPRIYGQARFFAVRQFLERKAFNHGPAICNVLQLVESLTPAKAASLSDESLRDIFDKFTLALEAHDLLEANRHHKLVQIARGDIQTSVTNLMDGARSGESKWASLQAAEKILKAAIELLGSAYKFGHDLAPHCQQLTSLGIIVDWDPLIRSIRCSAGIRYGDETCTRDEAVSAHQASLSLVVALAKAGVNFRRGLG